MIDQFVDYVRSIYQTNDFIPLHEPHFTGNEKRYINETIDSSYVSSIGAFVNCFEKSLQEYTGAEAAIATSSGTSAIHTALHLCGVSYGDLVISPSLTFVAACNVIHHLGAAPIFIDVSPDNLGLCPNSLRKYLEEHATINAKGDCIHQSSGRVIRAALPMHTFGHPADMDALVTVCSNWNIQIIEDAAESLGSLYKGRHTGTLSKFGTISFNGNKIITTGAGGAILCSSDDATRAKHITTTAKVPHDYEFFHDEAGFNYRMPNLNASLGCAQLENLEQRVKAKRQLAKQYEKFFSSTEYTFVTEPQGCQSNYWLNAVICEDKQARDRFLQESNKSGIMTRPVWTLMHHLPMFTNAFRGNLEHSEWLEKRLINIPSTPLRSEI